MADSFGTAFSALLARTSWKVRPGNSGTSMLRSSPRTVGRPGSVAGSSKSSRCASHRMPTIRTHVRTRVQQPARWVPDPPHDPDTDRSRAPGGPVTDTPLTPLATALSAAGRLVDALAGDAWDRQTPCSDWTVRQLVGHLVGGNRLVARALRGEELPPPGQLGHRDPADQLGDDPAAAWQESADGLLAAFALPGVLERTHTVPAGTLPGPALVHLRVVETL